MRLALPLIFLLGVSVHAETAEDARKQLSSTLSAIKESGSRQKELERKTATLQAELERLQEQMAELGKDTSAQEADLSSYEDKLAILEEQKRDKSQAFAARQDELASMISAMVKLRQLPPEAIIAMPGKLDETLATARALGVITHAIEEEARSLKEQLRELDLLEDDIRHHRTAISTRKTSLGERQRQLAAKVRQRSELVEKLGGEERAERERAAALTAKSENLQDLVESLQKSEAAIERKKASLEAKRHKTGGKLRALARLRMPAAGRIVSRFGNGDAGPTFAKGMVLETRSEAEVVAPSDGEVVFAGPFRDYGNLVIIRHGGDFHTMLSGLDAIDCKPGQNLLEGEPVGSMGAAGGTRLYLELREGGRPVDPSRFLKGDS